jgi:hypothetical protein
VAAALDGESQAAAEHNAAKAAKGRASWRQLRARGEWDGGMEFLPAAVRGEAKVEADLG